MCNDPLMCNNETVKRMEKLECDITMCENKCFLYCITSLDNRNVKPLNWTGYWERLIMSELPSNNYNSVNTSGEEGQ